MAPAGIGDSLEGLHAVAAAVRAGRVTELLIEQQVVDRDEYQAMVTEARERGAEVRVVADVRDQARTGAPQGVLARARPIPAVDLDVAIGRSDPPALLVFDHVEDPRNVGAAVRSAVAAGVLAIVVPSRRAAPLGATAFKAAAGAFEEVAIVTVSSVPDALRELRRRDIWTVGLDASASGSLFGLGLLAEPVAVVIGAEGRGLSRLARERVDELVRIPIAPGVESLNASVAAALAVFEVARVRDAASGS